MRIKKFTAGSMREALMQIKSELGEEAIILKTRKLPKKVFALGGHENVEVTAAIDESVPPQPAMPPIKMGETGVYARPRQTSNIIDPSTPGAPEIKTWEPPRTINQGNERTAKLPRRADDQDDQMELAELRRNVNELRVKVKEILDKEPHVDAGGFCSGWAIVYKKLVDSEVKPNIAETLLRQIGATDIMLSDSQAAKHLTTALSASIPVAGPLKLKTSGPLIVTFIGPTGNGKTTTLAKLAAHCCIHKKKRVSIITADTYRIAAIEQIRMFAEIIKVNVQVVFSPQEINAVVHDCASDDIIFVDTAGRSQHNQEHMADLKELMASLHSDEVHLVLSATTKDTDLIDCIERYRPFGINRLLFTKLDETGKIGNLLNTVHTSRIPVSYFTTGQSVPDDIEVAQSSRFVHRLFEGCSL
jgi:flagellar biosynthesis protein FlhF